MHEDLNEVAGATEDLGILDVGDIELSQRKEISVTRLIQPMREELVRRNYAATTIHSYLKAGSTSSNTSMNSSIKSGRMTSELSRPPARRPEVGRQHRCSEHSRDPLSLHQGSQTQGYEGRSAVSEAAAAPTFDS